MFLIRIYFWFTDLYPSSMSVILGFKIAYILLHNYRKRQIKDLNATLKKTKGDQLSISSLKLKCEVDRGKNPFERIFTLKGAWRNVRNVGFIRQCLYREALSLQPTLEGVASHFQCKSICESRWFTGSVCLGNVEIYSFNPSALPQPFSSPVHFYWASFVSCLSSVEGSRKERLGG